MVKDWCKRRIKYSSVHLLPRQLTNTGTLYRENTVLSTYLERKAIMAADSQQIEQFILINASLSTVENCFTDLTLMHQWLNPVLRCEPIGEWSTDVGSKSRFVIRIPGIQPTLSSTVVERSPGLVVWAFEGFFTGRDRWECQAMDADTTRLLNRFEFDIPNPLVKFGFKTFAASWTRRDMQAQLQRLKQVAEGLEGKGNG